MFDILWLFAAAGVVVVLPKYLGIIAYELAVGRFKAEQDCYPIQEIQYPPEEENNGEQGQA